MAEVIEMPKMSDTMTEGLVSAWLKPVGSAVRSGDVLAEVQTDKATMELESYFDGVVLYVGVKDGDSIPVGQIIAIIGKEGEDVSSYLTKSSSGSGTFASGTSAPAQPVSAPPAATQTVVTDNEDRLKASPLARAIAREQGVALEHLTGSGDGGRIIKRDVESFLTKPAPVPATVPRATSAPVMAPVSSDTQYMDVPVSPIRRTIARRLSESKFSAPHFYLTMPVEMDRAAEFRDQLNAESSVKISFNDLIVKAVAVALTQHPKVNVSWYEEVIREHHEIHIGVAVAAEQGLFVPVIRNANHKGLSTIATENKTLAEKAKQGRLQPAEFTGNTFTVSNLGMFGIEEFTAIINPPDACILAVGAILEQPVVRNGELAVGKAMRVTLSCDHRAVDGAVGSAFLRTFKQLLENPIRLLL
jgi:pyruvate dehydrogenase E2 component (dihydrolipoamide acetyltransferase)